MKQQGFVLMTVIIILSVMTLLVVADFRWLIWDYKQWMAMHNFQERNQQLALIAESVAEKLVLNAPRSCVLDIQFKDQQMKPIIAENTCIVMQQYHYGITDLGVYPCVKLSSKLSTHHWLVTIMDEQLPNRLLQLRVVTAEADEFCEKNQIVKVKAGILTHRWG
ncbi:MAG: hypothetical protein ACO1N3_01910 [Gammaproteobacteria bacterium]